MTPKKQLIDIFAGYKATYETMQREKQQGLTDVSNSMDSTTQFLQTKLNDDLSLAE